MVTRYSWYLVRRVTGYHLVNGKRSDKVTLQYPVRRVKRYPSPPYPVRVLTGYSLVPGKRGYGTGYTQVRVACFVKFVR